MKPILRDHFRRWCWVWLAGIIGNAVIVLEFCATSNHNQNRAFFPLGIFMGAFVLAFDLQRGHARAVLAMPVTAKQIARSWWWASVGIPAAAIAIVTMLVFTIYSGCSGNWSSLPDCIIFCVTNFLMLGFMFFALTGLPAQRSGGNWIEHIRGIIFGGLWGLSVGGWWFFQKLNLQTTTGAVLLSIATILTIVGWFRAETLVRERGGFRMGVAAGAKKPGQYKAPAGFGGLPFLWQRLFIRLGYMGLAIVAWLLVMQLMMHGSLKLSPKQFFDNTLPAFSSFGYFIIYMCLLLPTIMQLRLLRTLPISASKLAATLVLMPAAPIFIIGLAWAAFSGSASESETDFLIPSSFLTCAALTAIGAPIFVWRGLKLETYLLLMLLVMASTLGPMFFHPAKIPPAVAALVSLGVIAIAFEITRRLLQSSSNPYRNHAAMMNAWGGGWR
jgi:hypothetical protein